ncbi:MAG: ISL3 family transposase [Clostridia bacterium]|nr:ISL3 family transposase [Clostridia bacterium]
MKYNLVAADLQEAIERYRTDLRIKCDLGDIATIMDRIHCDGDATTTSSYKNMFPDFDPNSPADGSMSKAEKRRRERVQQKWDKHCRDARRLMSEVQSRQTALILNAEIDQEHCDLLLECLDALLQYQMRGHLDGIIGLPHAEIEFLNSVQRINSTQANDEDLSFLKLPSDLPGFRNTHSFPLETDNLFPYFVFYGEATCDAPACPRCGGKMTSKGRDPIVLRHVPIGNSPSFVVAERKRYLCNDKNCGCTTTPQLPFQDKDHRITIPARTFAEKLLSATFNLKDTSEITGLGINIVKDIDMARLKALYTENGEKLKKPEAQSTYLSIDEFKLHNGHQYATIIIDLETRHILWVQRGKKKQVVYNFFEHVGDEWMKGVKAVACDMNSDFQEAFEDRYPHIRVVFDHFHIVKNFNDKVITKVRIDEQKRLEDAGEVEAARSLKKSNYILKATKATLQKLDEDAKKKKLYRKGSKIFNEPPVFRKGGKSDRYEALIKENELLLTCDLVKGALQEAYTTTGDTWKDRLNMGKKISKIIRLCKSTKNDHFLWFAKLLENHRKGIIAYATFPITSGIIEGVNQKIKTIRRNGYGYPDDEYFFLKIIDASRVNYSDKKRKMKLKPYIAVTPDEIREMVA